MADVAKCISLVQWFAAKLRNVFQALLKHIMASLCSMHEEFSIHSSIRQHSEATVTQLNGFGGNGCSVAHC